VTDRRKTISHAVLLFALGAVLRLAYIFIFRPSFASVYWSLSSGLLDTGSLSVDGMTVTDFEPLYPMFVAGMRLLLGHDLLIVQGGQAIVASVGAVYIYLLGYALSGRERIALIAGALYAVDPLLIRQASGASDLALTSVLLAMFAYYFVTSQRVAQMAAAATVLGLVVLTRAMVLPLVPLAVAVLVTQRRIREAFALTLTVLIMFVPLVIRNSAVNGSWVPTRSGLNLYIGNSALTSAVLPDNDVDILQEQADNEIAAQLSHLPYASPEYSHAADALLMKHAVDYMTERPWKTVRQKFWNIAYFFSPRLVPLYVAGPDTRAISLDGRVVVEHPYSRPMIEVLSYSLFYTPVLLGAMWGVYLSGWDVSRAAILWCIVGTFVTIHTIYFPATRYRAPMEFVLLLYAAVAFDYLANIASRGSTNEGEELARPFFIAVAPGRRDKT
jgi:hypothetical protein